MASLFVRALGGIERHAANAPPPALFIFGRTGRVRPQRL